MFIDVDPAAFRSSARQRIRALTSRSGFVLCVLPLWLSAFAVFRPLAEPDEGRYTHIARSMMQTGDWLIPRIDGLPFLHKPPLYFWLEALCIKAFGLHLWTARLPSLMAGLMTCACVYSLAARYAGERAGRWTVALLATSPMFFAGAQFANLDMLVSSLITLTLTLTVVATAAPDDGASRWLLMLAYITAGLGVLTKGLIGVALPGGIFVLWALAQGKPRLILRAISIPGLAALLLVTVPWFWAVDKRIPGFLHHFFIYHHLERFLTQEFNGQYGAWFYPLVAGAGLLPWTILLIGPLRNRVGGDTLRRSLGSLGLIWFGFVMVFYSLPASKMIGYIFPVLPGFAIVAGPALAGWRWRYEALALAACMCVAFGAIGPAWQKYTPIQAVNAVAEQIGPSDELVFMDHFSYDVLVRLDRSAGVHFYGDWSKRAEDMPDSLRRQFTEGSEFEPAKRAGALIDMEGLQRLIAARETAVWLIVDKDSQYEILAGLPTVAEDKHVRILRAAAPEGDSADRSK